MILSLDYGSPYGGQPLTITGSGFGATAGSVAFGDLPASIVSWSDAEVQVLTPERPTFVAASVAVTLTPAAGPAQTAAFRYRTGRMAQAYAGVIANLARMTLADGYSLTLQPAAIVPLNTNGDADNPGCYPWACAVLGDDTIPVDETNPSAPMNGASLSVPGAVCLYFEIRHDFQAEALTLAEDVGRALKTDPTCGGITNDLKITGYRPLLCDNGVGAVIALFTLEIVSSALDPLEA